MNAVLEIGLSNAAVATLLAAVAWCVTRVWRRPQVALVLWLAVLAKLVTPGLLVLPLASLRSPTVEQGEPAATLATAGSPEHVEALPILDPATIADAPVDVPLAALEAELAQLIAATPKEAPPPEDSLADPIVEEPPLPGADNFDAQIDRLQDNTVDSDPANADLHDELVVAEQMPEPPDEIPAEPSPSYHWPSALAGLWLIGVVAWLTLAVARVVRFRRALQLAEPAGADLIGEVARLAAKIGLARSPAVRLTRRRVPPLVWGLIGRPTMLLPVELVENLSDEARETLLVHELAHLTRRAMLARWLELAAVGLYWWHPVAWWARRNVEEAEEQCCDARVVAMLPHAARAYAETLLATVEFLAEPGGTDPGGVAPWGARAFAEIGPIQRRLTMILDERASQRMTWPARAMLAIVALAALPVSISALWADPAKAPDATVEVAKAEDPKPAAGVVEAQPAVGAVEAVAAEASPATAAPVEAAAVEKPAAVATEKPAEKPAENSVEARLERLERLLEMRTPLKVELTPAQETKPVAEPKPTAETKSPSLVKELKERPKQYTPAVLDTRSLSELEREIDDVVDRTQRQAEMQVRLLEANSNRLAATQRQVEALTKAYDTGTITADQVLEAIRRRAEARKSHASMASDLTGPNGLQEYLRELGGLIAAEQARRDTKAFWIALVDRGAPKNEIAQASVQHELYNAQVRLSSDTVKRLQRYRVDQRNSAEQRSAEERVQAVINYNRARDVVQAVAVGQAGALTEADHAKQREREERLLAAKNTLLAADEAVTQRLADIKAMDLQAKRLRAASRGDKDTAKKIDVELETMQNMQQMLEHKHVEAVRARVLALHQLEYLLDEPSRLARAQTAAAPVPAKSAEDRDGARQRSNDLHNQSEQRVRDRFSDSVQQLFDEVNALHGQMSAIQRQIKESEKREAAEGEAAREANRSITAGYKAKLELLRKKQTKLTETMTELKRVWSLTDATVKELNPQAPSAEAKQPESTPNEKPESQPAPAPADAKQPQSRRQSRERVLATTVGLAEKLSDPALDECQRDGVYAVALRAVADEALADAREVWRQVHTSKQRSGGTLASAREAQAREQYYRFKAQAQVAASQAAWFGY